MSSLVRSIFELGFQKSPIILSGGVATLIPGGLLPIIALTQSVSFAQGLLSGNVNLNIDNFFADFRPLSGATLIENQLGRYPFANQGVAANAVIVQPKRVSMLMQCPPRADGSMTSRLLTLTALQQVLTLHISQGGLFTVATPSFLYINCVLLKLADASQGANTKHVQTAWQFDFEQPLITLDQAATSYSAMLSKIDGGLPVNGELAWSGTSTSVGSAVSGAATNLNGVTTSIVGLTPISVTSIQ